jgi:hypothetical protein
VVLVVPVPPLVDDETDEPPPEGIVDMLSISAKVCYHAAT